MKNKLTVHKYFTRFWKRSLDDYAPRLRTSKKKASLEGQILFKTILLLSAVYYYDCIGVYLYLRIIFKKVSFTRLRPGVIRLRAGVRPRFLQVYRIRTCNKWCG